MVEALRAAAAGTRDPLRAARLRLQEGQLDEVELQDLPGRWTPTGRPTSAIPGGPRSARRWCGRRRAAGSGRWRWRRRWPPGVSRDNLERTYLPLLEALCTEAGAWGALAEATTAALAGPARITDPVLARDLEVRLARWWEAAGGNKSVERASVALARAAAQARAARDAGALGSGDGFAASEPDILRRLAGIQRAEARAGAGRDPAAAGGPDAHRSGSAARGGAVSLESKQAEPLRAIALGRLLDQSTRLLRAGQTPAGKATADEAAAFAALALADLESGRADRSAWSRAVELLLDTTRLPLPKDVIRKLRARAVDLAQRQAARPAPGHPASSARWWRTMPATSRRWPGWPPCTTKRSGCPSCWPCARKSWPAPRRWSAG